MRLQPLMCRAEEVRDAVRAPEIQMRIVFPGDSDAAEHLNAVLRVRLRGVDARSRGHRHCDGQLPLVGIAHRSRSVGRGHRGLLGAQQHLGAHVLDGLETADRLAELLAHLRVLRRGLQRPARQPGGFGRQHGGRHIGETLRRRGQRLCGCGVQHDTGQWPREIGRLQRFDRDAVGSRVDQHDGISGGKQQEPGRISAKHVFGGAGRNGAVELDIGRQGDARNALAGDQQLQDVGPLDQQGGQCRGRDRARNKGRGRFVDHRAQILDGAVGAALLLGERDAEDSQLSQAVIGGSPRVRLALLDVACRRGGAGSGRPATNQLARGKLFVGNCG